MPSFRNRATLAILAAIAVVTMARVATTHRVFSHTLDEPAHLAAGYDWLAGAPYTLDATHPPLARVLAAIPARFEKVEMAQAPHFVDRGNSIFYAGERYHHNLSAARSGNLLLLAIAIAAVAAWAWQRFDAAVAIVATILFTSIPALLGHAGLITTDLAIAATLPLAIVAFGGWLDAPSWKGAVALGLAVALGALSKFSFLLFFPLSAASMILLRATRPTRIGWKWRELLGAFAICILGVWAGYRFDIGTISSACSGCGRLVADAAPPFASPAADWFVEKVPVPAPLFIVGVQSVRDHARSGHQSFLLGEIRDHGWWYYFPVIFFYKTPLPFQLLVLIGAGVLIRRATRANVVALEPLVIGCIVMLSVLPSTIDIGIRHILPIYAPLAIVAAIGTIALWRSRIAAARLLVAALVTWHIGGVALAHPDYLAWFNEAAGAHPERIALDSNLDWGQDVLRLGRVLREMKIESYGALIVTTTMLDKHAPGSRPIPAHPEPGWFVVSETAASLDDQARSGAYDWLLRNYRPVRTIGKSLRLYHVQ